MNLDNKKKFYKTALKHFTLSTTDLINEELKYIDVDFLITDMYLKFDNDEVNYLIKEYEKQLILSKLNFPKFCSNLHEFFLNMNKIIKENNLYRNFFKLAHLVYIGLNMKDVNTHVMNAYHDILIQQYAYFGGSTKTIAYGISNKKGLLFTPEVGVNLTVINMEMENVFKHNSKDKMKEFRSILLKYGYSDIEDLRDFSILTSNDQLNTNMLYQMAYFIDEDNKFLLPRPFRDPTKLLKINPVLMAYSAAEHISFIEEKLRARQMLIPQHGITAKFKNNKDVCEIFLTEQIVDDNVILIFKVKFSDNTYTLGFYDSEHEVYYDMYVDSTHEDVTTKFLRGLVLQLYLYVTCELTEEEFIKYCWFIPVQDLKDVKDDVQPYVEFSIFEKSLIKHREVSIERHFNKSDYIATLKNIKPFLRKLPVGASASEEAISMAQKYNIELPAGYTFVKGFNKKVYSSKEN